LFLPAIAFAVYYYLVMDKFEVVSCSVFYASYTYPLGTAYGFFYYAPVAYSIIFLSLRIKNTNDESKKKLSKVLLGGLLFISLPVLTAFILLAMHNELMLGIIESVMCKFAFVYAVCLGYFSLLNKKAVYE
jgi:cobalamin biosynthesis protein CobD/CbiB